MPGRNFNAPDYRFGYNQGSEKDDEITGVTGSHYTTFYRELDTRVVRWWAIDPKTNLTPWESPYASMGNNPIWHNDPLGDIWDRKKDEKTATKMDTEANKKIGKHKSEITNLQKGTGNDDAIKDLQARIGELQSSITERAAMGDKNDPTRYRFKEWKKDYGDTKTSVRIGDFGQKTDVVTMRYGDMGDAFHEQLHGFKIGQRLLGKDNTRYSVSEEVAAKRREYSIRNMGYINKAPLMQGGYFSITNAKWVERVIIRSNDPAFIKTNPKYIKISNVWLKSQGRPIIK